MVGMGAGDMFLIFVAITHILEDGLKVGVGDERRDGTCFFMFLNLTMGSYGNSVHCAAKVKQFSL